MNTAEKENARTYWKANIKLVLSLLGVWFVASYGMAVLFANILNDVRFYGFKLGFWMAQQGAIFVFVGIVFIYVYRMNKLDRQYGVDEGSEKYVEDEDYYHHEESLLETFAERPDGKEG